MQFETLKIATTALRRNKTRTVLTVLGIVIGISAVIAVMSAGEGIKSFVIQQVETFGTDTIEVEIKVPNTKQVSAENAVGMAMGIEITTLTLDDQTAIKKLPNIKDSYAGVNGQELISYGGVNKQSLLFGVSPSFVNIDQGKIEAGRFFTDDEDRSLANVAVIGSKVKEKLFGESDFLDKSIKVGRQKFRVIGSMESRGATFGFDMDDMIFVPIQTLQKKLLGINHVTFLFAQVYDTVLIDQTVDEIEALLRERHEITDPDKDDFAVVPMTEALEILDTVFWAITMLLIAIAGISLVVGGVGIMNIMYVSVIERTYEIGLRKAVGASSSKILSQFLWEAIVVTLLGAGMGIVFGVGLAWLVSVVAETQGFAWHFVVLPSSLVLACGVAIAIGVIFGVFPARAAAKMDPVTALRRNR